MKKTVLLIAIPIVVILFSVCGLLITKNTTNRLIKEQNSEYEYYLDKTVYGTDLTTVIGKAVNENENNTENDENNDQGEGHHEISSQKDLEISENNNTSDIIENEVSHENVEHLHHNSENED